MTAEGPLRGGLFVWGRASLMIAATIEVLPRFPCAKDKRPLTPHGHRDANPNPVDEWRWPLTGVPTGAVSGFDVLDIDLEGAAWMGRWKLPMTRVHSTRSGGQHWLFVHAEGLRGSRSRIVPGVDICADGSPPYVFWWPRAGLPVLSDAPIAPWPEWLLVVAHKKPTPRVPHVVVPQLQRHGTLVAPAAQELPKSLYFAIVRCKPPSPHDQRRVAGIIKDLINCRSLRNNRLNWAGHALREFSLVATARCCMGAA
jgi:hypothetical protein